MPWRIVRIDEQQEEKQLLLAPFALALAIRLVFIIPAAGMLVGGDAGCYDEIARNLLSGVGYVVGAGALKTYSAHPPLYPIFVAMVYFLSGYNVLVVQISQGMLGAITCVLIYLTARRLTNRRVAWIASLMAVVYPTLIFLTRETMTETLFILILCLWTWFVVTRAEELLSLKNQAVSGILVGLLALTRAVALFLPVFVLIWQWMCSAGTRRQKLLASASLIFFVVLTLAPWTIRNYRVHHTFVPVATQGGEILWIYKVKLKGLTPPTDYRYLPPSWYELPEAERSNLALRETLRVLKEQPFKFIKNSLIGSFAIFRPFTPITDYNFSLGILLPLAAMGVFFSVKFGRKISITHLLLVNFWAMAVLTYGHPRFLVPLLPSLFILAAYATDSLLKMDRKAFGIVMGLILSVNLLIAIWFPQIRAFVEGPLKTMLLR